MDTKQPILRALVAIFKRDSSLIHLMRIEGYFALQRLRWYQFHCRR